MNVKERIIQFVEFKGISTNAFEKSIGASKSYISNTKNISADIASNILLVYSELSAEWLLRGEGEMLKQSNLSLDENPSQKDTEQNAEYWKHIALTNMEIMTLHVDDLNARIKELEAEILNLKSNGSMELSSSANPA